MILWLRGKSLPFDLRAMLGVASNPAVELCPFRGVVIDYFSHMPLFSINNPILNVVLLFQSTTSWRRCVW